MNNNDIFNRKKVIFKKNITNTVVYLVIINYKKLGGMNGKINRRASKRVTVQRKSYI